MTSLPYFVCAAWLTCLVPALALDSAPPEPARPVSPDVMTARPGSAVDVSGMSVKPPGATRFGTLGGLLGRTALPELFGAVGNGMVDDSAAIVAAANSFGGQCGTVDLTWGRRYRVGASFQLPPCITIRGASWSPDDPQGSQTSLFNAVGGLFVDPTASITLNSSSGIRNAYVVQNGLTLPAPDGGGFSGTAIACSAPSPARSNGPFLEKVLFIGFTQVISCTNTDRPRFDEVYFDSVNGLYSSGSYDTSYFNRMRGWPYASVGFTGWSVTGARGTGTTATLSISPASTLRVGTHLTVSGMSAPGYDTADAVVTASSSGSVSYASTATGAASGGTLIDPSQTLGRLGTAFDLEGQQDDTHITNSFAFGYANSFTFGANGNLMGDMLWSDQVPYPVTGSTGFLFKGTIGRTSFGQLYANGSTYALRHAVVGSVHAGVDIAELFAHTLSPGGECINVAAGTTASLNIANVNIVGCSSWALDIASAPNARVRVGGGTITGAQGGSTTGPYIAVPQVGALSSNIVIDTTKLVTDLQAGASLIGNGQLRDLPLASATTLAPPATGVDAFALSGTHPITTIRGAFGGRELLFTCTAACDFANGGNIALSAGIPFVGAPGAQIKLRFDANNTPPVWREQWRATP